MKISSIARLLTGLYATVSFAACTSDSATHDQRICTTIGCGSAVTIRVRLPGTFTMIKTYTVEVCRNGECLSDKLAGLTNPPDPGTGVGVTFPDPATAEKVHTPHVDATVFADEKSGFRLEAQYWPWSMDDLHDGDEFRLSVRDAAGNVMRSVTRAVTYTVSYPNGEACGPVCRSATIDAPSEPPEGGTEPDAEPNPDASVPLACVLEEKSSLPHVHIVSKATKCVFTLAEARAGIAIPYDVVIDQDVPGFSALHPYPYGANVSALSVSEELRGGTQSYCLCDQGLPYASCPEPDGGIVHPQGGGPCDPVTLKKGVYPQVFAWDGVNWTGPSDTSNPKGPPFPPGDYTLTISSAPGTIAGDASTGPVQASTKLLVRLVP
jgi:hypothetical protein